MPLLCVRGLPSLGLFVSTLGLCRSWCCWWSEPCGECSGEHRRLITLTTGTHAPQPSPTVPNSRYLPRDAQAEYWSSNQFYRFQPQQNFQVLTTRNVSGRSFQRRQIVLRRMERLSHSRIRQIQARFLCCCKCLLPA